MSEAAQQAAFLAAQQAAARAAAQAVEDQRKREAEVAARSAAAVALAAQQKAAQEAAAQEAARVAAENTARLAQSDAIQRATQEAKAAAVTAAYQQMAESRLPTAEKEAAISTPPVYPTLAVTTPAVTGQEKQSAAIQAAVQEAAVKAAYVQAADLKTGERVLSEGKVSTPYEAQAAITYTNYQISQATKQNAQVVSEYKDVVAHKDDYTPESFAAYKKEYEKYQENYDAFVKGSLANLSVLKGVTKQKPLTKTYAPTQAQIEAGFTEANKDLEAAIKSDKYVITYIVDGKTKTKTFTTRQQADEFIDSIPVAKADTSWIYTTPRGEQSTGGAKGLTVLGVTFVDRSAMRGKELPDLSNVAENIGKIGEVYENIFRSVTKSAEVTAEKLHQLSPSADVFRLPVKAGVGAFNAATFVVRPAEWAGAANLITALMTPEKGETAAEYRTRITAFVEGDIADPAERERLVNQLVSVMPQNPINATDIQAAKAVREAVAESIVNDPAGFVAQIAGGVIGGYIIGDAIQNIPQIKKAISRLSIEQRMWDKITPLDEIPLEKAGDIAPFKGGIYDESNIALPDNYSGPVLWTRGTWSKMSAWKEDPLHLGGTAVVALRETGTKNIVGYMTWEEVVKSTGGIPELFGLMGVITLPNGTKVYAEPGFATIPLNEVDAGTLHATITRLDTPTLREAIVSLDKPTLQKLDIKTLTIIVPQLDSKQIKVVIPQLNEEQIQTAILELNTPTLKEVITGLDEDTTQKLDVKTLVAVIPQLDLKTLQDIVPKLDDATIQKIALSQILDTFQVQNVVQSLTTTQTQDLVQSLSFAQLEIVAPLLTTVQITELTKKLPLVKRDSLLRILKKEVKPSVGEDRFTVSFTDMHGRTEVVAVKARLFKEAYLRARNLRRWHGELHSVDITRKGKSLS